LTLVEPEVQSYVLFRVEVVRTELVSPKMLRVTFGGRSLSGCVWAGHDHRIKLFLPLPGQLDPIVPEGPDWFAAYRAMPEEIKPPMRTFTIRELRGAEMDVDFVLHGDIGPAGRWANRARPGDRVAILGPNALCPTIYGYEYRPDADTDWTLLAGDETALPAITAILASLPSERRALVFLEVDSAEEIRRLPCAGDVRVTWLSRDGAPAAGGGLLREAISRMEFPPGRPYAWLAGESSTVTGLRRHLVRECGVDKKDVYFSGYWMLGSAIE
jgi:NADPH-dependent ferric siderophore reductase